MYKWISKNIFSKIKLDEEPFQSGIIKLIDLANPWCKKIKDSVSREFKKRPCGIGGFEKIYKLIEFRRL